MNEPIDTFECTSGGAPHCYGCYTMDRDKEGHGDWLRKSDVLARLSALRETSLGMQTLRLDALILELSK